MLPQQQFEEYYSYIFQSPYVYLFNIKSKFKELKKNLGQDFPAHRAEYNFYK